MVPFERNEDGEFVMGKAYEAPSADSARFRVHLLAESGKGGVASAKAALSKAMNGAIVARPASTDPRRHRTGVAATRG